MTLCIWGMQVPYKARPSPASIFFYVHLSIDIGRSKRAFKGGKGVVKGTEGENSARRAIMRVVTPRRPLAAISRCAGAWNGFPLLQYDTGGYLALVSTLGQNRSTVYGLFLNALTRRFLAHGGGAGRATWCWRWCCASTGSAGARAVAKPSPRWRR